MTALGIVAMVCASGLAALWLWLRAWSADRTETRKAAEAQRADEAVTKSLRQSLDALEGRVAKLELGKSFR